MNISLIEINSMYTFINSDFLLTGGDALSAMTPVMYLLVVAYNFGYGLLCWLMLSLIVNSEESWYESCSLSLLKQAFWPF